MDKRGEDGRTITKFYHFFCLTVPENFVGRTFLFPTKFLASKYFMDKRWGVKEGGVSRYCVKKFLSQSTERLRRGTLLFFLQNFWYRKNSWIRGGE